PKKGEPTMRSIRFLILAAVCCLLASPHARADGGRGDDGSPGRPPGVRVVDCSCGDTIAQALLRVRPGDTLSVRGTCNESVIVNSPIGQFDGVTLDGGGTATIAGPDPTLNVLELDNVRSFTVKGLT